MNRSIETRLDRLLEARQEQDAATVRGIIGEFLGGMPPQALYECRELAVLRPRLNDFLAAQPDKMIRTIERWAKTRKRAK